MPTFDLCVSVEKVYRRVHAPKVLFCFKKRRQMKT